MLEVIKGRTSVGPVATCSSIPCDACKTGRYFGQRTIGACMSVCACTRRRRRRRRRRPDRLLHHRRTPRDTRQSPTRGNQRRASSRHMLSSPCDMRPVGWRGLRWSTFPPAASAPRLSAPIAPFAPAPARKKSTSRFSSASGPPCVDGPVMRPVTVGFL
jgi:hypothetical protein